MASTKWLRQNMQAGLAPMAIVAVVIVVIIVIAVTMSGGDSDSMEDVNETKESEQSSEVMSDESMSSETEMESGDHSDSTVGSTGSVAAGAFSCGSIPSAARVAQIMGHPEGEFNFNSDASVSRGSGDECLVIYSYRAAATGATYVPGREINVLMTNCGGNCGETYKNAQDEQKRRRMEVRAEGWSSLGTQSNFAVEPTMGKDKMGVVNLGSIAVAVTTKNYTDLSDADLQSKIEQIIKESVD